MSFELERGGGRFKDRIVGFVFPNSIVSESGGFPEYTLNLIHRRGGGEEKLFSRE